jgi:predicted phosphodiesterase
MLSGELWSLEEVRYLKETYPDYNKFKEVFDRGANGYFRKARKLNLHKTTAAHYIATPNSNIGVTSLYQLISPKEVTPRKKEHNFLTGPLELVEGKEFTSFIMLNDVHVPHNIDLTNVFEFMGDYKPDYVLLVGDIINNDPFSHWERARRGTAKTMPKPKAYFEQCQKEFFDPLRKFAGKNANIGYWLGNHEMWSQKAIDDMPEGEGYWEVENNITGIDFWVGSKGIASLGKLHFIHGDNFSGRGHANKILNVYRRNMRYGHFHNIEESTHNDPIDMADRHTARCCGTLEKFNPGFMTNRPHSWMHAFTYGIVENSTGIFWDHTAQIINNKFMANGRIYG